MAEPATSTKKEPEAVLITMEDGRKVEFVGKQRMKKEGFEEDNELVVRFDFVNGAVVKHTMPKALYRKYAIHGALQKLGDSASDCKNVEDMVEAVSTTAGRLRDEDSWNVKREAGGFAGAHVIVRALMEYRSRTREQVNEWIERKLAEVDGLTRPKLYASLRATEALKPIIAKLEAETIAKDSKTGEDLLADA